MKKATKPRCAAWEHYNLKTVTGVDGKIVKSYECKYCSAVYKPHATRLKDHLGDCKKAPQHIKNEFSSRPCKNKNKKSSSYTKEMSKNPPPRSSSTSSLSKFMDSMSPAENVSYLLTFMLN